MTNQLTMIKTPLASLVKDPQNVRSRDYAEEDVRQLADMIASKGLLQPPLVRQMKGGKKPVFGVSAGGRRLAALNLLAVENRLPEAIAKEGVDVILRDNNTADVLEVSLMENFNRAPLSAVEEMRAFQSVQSEGQSIEQISNTFGVPVRIVKQRLALADIHADILAAFDEGDMSLDALKAFTLSSDQETQKRVFDQLSPHNLHPSSIRKAISQEGVTAGNKLASFATVEAYIERGGEVLQNLFDEDQSVLTNASLLHEICLEKLELEAERLRNEGWADVRVFLEADYNWSQNMDPLYQEERELTEDEAARVKAIVDERNDLTHDLRSTYDSAERQVILERIRILQDELDALTKADFTLEDKARASLAVFIGHEGAVELSRPYVTSEEGASGASSANADPDHISGSLAEDYNAIIEAEMRFAITQNADVAYLVSTAALAQQAFYVRSPALTVGAVERSKFDHKLSGANQEAFAEQYEIWSERLAQIDGSLIAELSEWKPADVKALHTFCAAVLYSRQCSYLTSGNTRDHEAVRQLTGFNPAASVPADEGFMGRLKRPQLVALCNQISDAKVSASTKKGDLVPIAVKRAKETGWTPAMAQIDAAYGSLGLTESTEADS